MSDKTILIVPEIETYELSFVDSPAIEEDFVLVRFSPTDSEENRQQLIGGMMQEENEELEVVDEVVATETEQETVLNSEVETESVVDEVEAEGEDTEEVVEDVVEEVEDNELRLELSVPTQEYQNVTEVIESLRLSIAGVQEAMGNLSGEYLNASHIEQFTQSITTVLQENTTNILNSIQALSDRVTAMETTEETDDEEEIVQRRNSIVGNFDEVNKEDNGAIPVNPLVDKGVTVVRSKLRNALANAYSVE